ncbi:MAG TPA: ABC transporter substrate-binding protein [Candidatus Limnocylindrales bacterium]|nr:ABC transporter substrate-binding protein [Candidatus Limnocylindrales bacterium]
MAAKRSLPAFLLAFLFVFLAACTNSVPTAAPTATSAAVATVAPTATPTPTATPVPDFPVTITDDEGTAVTIKAKPQKIVSLTPATTETLFAIGAGTRVVGKVQDVADYPPQASGVPEVATFAGVDVEKIVALTPDLVISGGAGLTQGDAVTKLRAAGIPVIVSYPTSTEAAASIKLIGEAVGERDAANTLADSIQDKLDRLSAVAATAKTTPRVFYEIDVTGGIFTPPIESLYGDMLLLAHSQPAPGNASYQISLEQLVAFDPEVILLGDGAYGATPDAVKKREGWGGMTAVKSGAIFPVDDIVITRPGPRIAEGLYDLVRAIHPELGAEACAAMRIPCPTPAPAAS